VKWPGSLILAAKQAGLAGLGWAEKSAIRSLPGLEIKLLKQAKWNNSYWCTGLFVTHQQGL